jgi:hypothetical protein
VQLLADIEEAESAYEDCLNFNQFAFGHTENRAINEILQAIADAENELAGLLLIKTDLITELCALEYPAMDEQMCCDQLTDEYDQFVEDMNDGGGGLAQTGSQELSTVDVPLDVCPVGARALCAEKLAELIQMIADVNYQYAFNKYLQDRADAADTTILDC